MKKSEIKYIVLHHSAVLQPPSSIDRYHRKTKKWSCIAYSYLVYPDGSIIECRGLKYQSAATKGFNRGAVSICLIGNFNKHKPTQQQIKSTVELCRFVLDYSSHNLTMMYHRDVCDTDCPGAFFPNNITKMVNDR